MDPVCFTLFQTTNLDSSKPKEFADDEFRFDEIDGKFLADLAELQESYSIRQKNIEGKGEIARYEQFLFSLNAFIIFMVRTTGSSYDKSQSLVARTKNWLVGCIGIGWLIGWLYRG